VDRSGTVAGVDLIPSPDGQEQTRFYPPRFKLLLLTVTSAFFTGLGYVISLSSYTWLSVIGWIMFLAFVLATLVMLARTLRPGPTAIFDAEGFTDRTQLVPTGLVRWDEITVMRKREIGRGMGRERVLEVVLREPERFYAREGSRLRQLSERLRRLRSDHLTIPSTMVSKPMPVIIAEVQRWCPDMQVLELPPPIARFRFSRHGTTTTGKPNQPRW
jgi:hypothetical protein